MTPPENPVDPGQNVPVAGEVQSELRYLRSQITALLICMLVLALSLDALFLYQVRAMRRQIGELNRFVGEYDRQTPLMDDFSGKLRAYGRTHPDFNAILAKYFSTAEPPRSNAPAPPAPVKR